MEYITVAVAAKIWGVSLRQAQRLLAAGRIPGAKKFGNSWLIPEGAEKPGDPRRERSERKAPRAPRAPRGSIAANLECYITAQYFQTLPHDNPDAFVSTINDERTRQQFLGANAYLRGNFDYIKEWYLAIEGDEAARLSASGLAFAAAMSTGDYPLFLETESFVKNTAETAGNKLVTVFAELTLSGAYIGAFAPRMACGWLKDGDFSALPGQLRLAAAKERVEYLWGIGEIRPMFDVAQTALGFCDLPKGIWFYDIYLMIYCSIACCALGRAEEAERWLLDAMRIALPHGFITPFAEHAAEFNGLLETLLEREYPEYLSAVTDQWKFTIPHWLDFHNRFTNDNLTQILSLRDYEMTRLAARGVSYREIAEHFNISEKRARNIIQGICEKLFIRHKKDLAKFIQ